MMLYLGLWLLRCNHSSTLIGSYWSQGISNFGNLPFNRSVATNKINCMYSSKRPRSSCYFMVCHIFNRSISVKSDWSVHHDSFVFYIVVKFFCSHFYTYIKCMQKQFDNKLNMKQSWCVTLFVTNCFQMNGPKMHFIWRVKISVLGKCLVFEPITWR